MHDFEKRMRFHLEYAIQKMEQDESYRPHPIIKALMLAISEPQESKQNNGYLGLEMDFDPETEMPLYCYGVAISKKGSDFVINSVEDFLNERPLDRSYVINILEISKKLEECPSDPLNIDEGFEILNSVPHPHFTFLTIPNEKINDAIHCFLDWYHSHKAQVPREFHRIIRDLLDSKLTAVHWKTFPGGLRSLIGMAWSQQLTVPHQPIMITSCFEFIEKDRLMGIYDLVCEQNDRKFYTMGKGTIKRRNKK